MMPMAEFAEMLVAKQLRQVKHLEREIKNLLIEERKIKTKRGEITAFYFLILGMELTHGHIMRVEQVL